MRNQDSGKLIEAANGSTRIGKAGYVIQDRTGEVRIMSCGQTATIVAYRSHLDMDVQFEDGTVAVNKRYQAFQLGYIKHPNITINTFSQHRQSTRNKRIGQSSVMNNGMRATIINYNGRYDIDIQFEDGVIVKGINYSSWVKGEVKHPTVKAPYKPRVTGESLKGQTNTMSNGMQATIIAARSVRDVDVQFEDGNIVEHTAYSSFKSGHICHPDRKDNRLGETRMMHCGMECTIIAYITHHNIIVKFTDGTRVANKYYSSFKNGSIQNPNMKRNRKKRNNKE